MNKTILLGIAIASVFVVGASMASLFTENIAFATHKPTHNPGGNDVIQPQIDALDARVTDLENTPPPTLKHFKETLNFNLPPISSGTQTLTVSCSEGVFSNLRWNAQAGGNSFGPAVFIEKATSFLVQPGIFSDDGTVFTILVDDRVTNISVRVICLALVP